MPCTTAVAGDLKICQGSDRPCDASIMKRQSTHEAIEHRVVELAAHDCRWVSLGCQPDLLLVVPALGVLPRSIEPVPRLRFSCPAHGELCVFHRIEGKMI